jgi:hypothetical protein
LSKQGQFLSQWIVSICVTHHVSQCRPLDDNYFDFLTGRYTYVRQFAPALLSAFTFRANRRGEPLVEAVSVLNRIKMKVLENAPVDFVSAKWRHYVIDEDGKFDRHYYEMCLLWELRGAPLAGDVWLEGSRRYANPETFLNPRDQWANMRGNLPPGAGSRKSGSPPPGAKTRIGSAPLSV